MAHRVDLFCEDVAHESFARSPCDEWKRELVDALERAGEIVITAGAEFAEEIVDGMELYRAGRADHSLRDFVDDLRAAFKRLP